MQGVAVLDDGMVGDPKAVLVGQVDEIAVEWAAGGGAECIWIGVEAQRLGALRSASCQPVGGRIGDDLDVPASTSSARTMRTKPGSGFSSGMRYLVTSAIPGLEPMAAASMIGANPVGSRSTLFPYNVVHLSGIVLHKHRLINAGWALGALALVSLVAAVASAFIRAP